MRVGQAILVSTLISTLVFGGGCARPTGESRAVIQSSVMNPRAERLQQVVERLHEGSQIPGLVVAVLETGRAPTLAAAGVSDRERGTPVSSDTSFFIGSISKNLFAAIALRLVEQGRLRLEDSLSRYVDWPRGDEIKVRMLLNHTSGIPDYLTRNRFTPVPDGGLPEFFRTPRTPVALLATIADPAPTFEPGSKQEYSNTNGLLVGEVIRRIAAKPLTAVFDEEIVRPLGLRQTYLFGEATAERMRSRGYCMGDPWGGAEGELVDCSGADEALPDSADGSVVASALDLLQYHHALREGELLSDESWAAMRTSEPGISNGLGYLIGEGPFGRYEGNVGRAMGHVAASVYYVDHDTYVVMMTNLGNAPLPLRPFLEAWFDVDAAERGERSAAN